MARQVRRISDLPEAAPLVGDELLEIVQGGENVRVRADELGGDIAIDDVAGLSEALDERVQDNDPRLSDSRVPTGGAGGVLSGQYPNPGFAVPMATAEQLDAKVDKVEGKGLSTNDLTDPLYDKLGGIQEGATKNATDAQLRDRATHTGTQPLSTISDAGTAAAADTGDFDPAGAASDAVVSHETTYDHTAYDAAVLKQQRQRLLEEATLSLDFVNNKYRVYEGIGAGMADKPFDEVLDHTRGSEATGYGVGKLETVEAGAPRLVRDPVSGKSEGLLVEEQRTNLLLWSEDFTDSAWIKARSTVEATSMAAPTGGNYFKHVVGTGESSGYLNQLVAVPSVGDFSAFYYVKQAELSSVRLQAVHQGEVSGGTSVVMFDLSSGTNTNVGTGDRITAVIMEPLSDGGYLIGVTWSIELATSTHGRLLQQDETYDGVSGIYVAAAQLEQGSAPSSYIPAEGAQVTRAADDVSRELGAEFNSGGFTVVMRGVVSVGEADAAQRLLSLNGGTSSERLTITGRTLITSLAGSSAVTNKSHIPNEVDIALSWDSITLTIYVNGDEWHSGEREIDTALFSQIQIGKDPSAGIRGATYSTMNILPRALSEQELIALTAPEA